MEILHSEAPHIHACMEQENVHRNEEPSDCTEVGMERQVSDIWRARCHDGLVNLCLAPEHQVGWGNSHMGMS